MSLRLVEKSNVECVAYANPLYAKSFTDWTHYFRFGGTKPAILHFKHIDKYKYVHATGKTYTHPTLEGATKHARNNQIAQILYKIFRKNINFSTLAKSDLIDITLCVDQFMNPGTKKGTIVFIATVVAELIKQDNKRDT